MITISVTELSQIIEALDEAIQYWAEYAECAPTVYMEKTQEYVTLSTALRARYVRTQVAVG